MLVHGYPRDPAALGEPVLDGTFLNELPPPLGPVSELLRIGLLDLGPLVHAVHEVIAETVPVVDPLHCALVVPHLGGGCRQTGMGAASREP